jgi:peptidoglycan hydrolase-like protein with peptidoglycan-binding domain
MGKAADQDVKKLQQALKAQGKDPGPVDGIMGPRTQQALKDYQKDQNLSQSGQLDNETRQKLGISR